ncbi:MAG: Penicillin-binding protein, 1A family [Candidatus Woesebacteria bacterium GW2011_GWB1_45_5]|uniref:Penicillin-binding protein, 1A family n=1 Tax=Candidatus Woesebacteria bacterium GW2011_GWB1_45_5 TaxID=1618581 RepID=A0A0G1MQF4_9BACT|nr:MAG: Penicillin-binding protein, 1A family [Candidatus Woesebacteria bacterium GW2011_GWB1_45_5]
MFSRLSEFVRLSLTTTYGRKRAVFFGILMIVSIYLFWGVPLPTKLSSPDIPVSTKLFDRNEKLIYEIFSDRRRTPIKIEEIPSYIKDATIAIEDKDFYKHRGFSFTGILRAAYKITFERKLEGGSTITQQLVKNALLSPERTVRRKIREFFLTMFVEGIYTKDQILEMYLNQIPYGGTAYGIEAASETYFGKAAKDLSLPEAALLAGLPQRPSTYSPFGAHPELAKSRQEEVLKQMVANKYITQEEADKAKNEKLNFASVKPPQAPHFALWIKEQLADKYGEKVVEQGGLRVYTTLDLEIQDIAQQAVATEVAKLKKQEVGNGAAIVTRPATGEILAMVGSKDYFATDEDGKVNVTLAKRQPGSSIKPLNYALAIKDEKITAATALADVPSCFNVAGQPLYCPVNYDGAFHGLVQTRFALGNSYNIPAVRVLALNGIDNFVEFAKQMGLSTLTDPSNYGLSLTLGGGEVRPFDMAQAFGVFANQGITQPLIAVTKVTDWKGNTLEETKLDDVRLTGQRVLTSEVTYIISHILLDNNARTQAFGPTSFLNVKGHPEVSVKTGTTNDRRDNWTIGYTAHAVTVTWVGNNDNKPMSGAVSGVSGASPIWNKIMQAVLDKAETGAYDESEEGHMWPQQPDSVTGANVCNVTGLFPPGGQENPGCSTRFEYFLEGTIPSKTDGGDRADLVLFNDTGQVAGSDALPEQVHTENRPVYFDPLGTTYCLDCPIASASATIRYPLR